MSDIGVMSVMGYLFKYFCRSLMYFLGWVIPLEDIKRLKSAQPVICMLPHTSAWEGVLGALIFGSHFQDTSTRIMMSECYFRTSWSDYLLRNMGFIPVNNKEANGTVNRVSKQLMKNEKYILAMTAEGTRQKKRKFRSGGHYIAQKTGARLIVMNFDYENHCICVSEPWKSTTLEEDMGKIKEIFSRHAPLYPENTTYGEKFEGTTLNMLPYTQCLMRILSLGMISWMGLKMF
jgi:1-acyl-sn-glycerol-3-phosphate acyltransferase